MAGHRYVSNRVCNRVCLEHEAPDHGARIIGAKHLRTEVLWYVVEMVKKGPYDVLSSEVKYKNPWMEVREDKVIRPDGKEGIFGTVDYGRGVVIVALDAKKNIMLVREYYYVLEEYLLQAPAGGIEIDETPLEAAQKELLEETGMVSSQWIELGFTHPLTLVIKSPAYLFLALDVTKQQEPEPETENVVLPFAEAYQMALDSKIPHAPSTIAILKAKIHLDLDT